MKIIKEVSFCFTAACMDASWAAAGYFFYFSELVYIPITVVFNTACTSTSLLELSMASSYFQYACVTYITPYMHAQE